MDRQEPDNRPHAAAATGIFHTRRALLGASAAFALTAPLLGAGARRALAQAPHAITTSSVGANMVLLQGSGGNVVALMGSDDVVLVDGGLASSTTDLLAAVAAASRARPVRTLFNTHWHWDHTGSNETLAQSGATLIAHENTRLWLGTEIVSRWENRTYPARPVSALPGKTFFYGAQQLSAAGAKIEYGYLPQAHTDGDLYVFFPEQNVLVAGDVVSGRGYPISDYATGGWLGGMIDSLKILLEKSDAKTKIIPGTGPVLSRAQLQEQLTMSQAVVTSISNSYYKGETWSEFIATRPTQAFDARWGNPDIFLRTAYDGAWGHITEIRRVTR